MTIATTQLPERAKTEKAKARRVGVEVELAGLSPIEISSSISKEFGGKVNELAPLVYQVKGTSIGDFKLELDAVYLQELNKKQASEDPELSSITRKTVDIITSAAELLVPWEIVAPPIKMKELHHLYPLIEDLRNKGAQGTRKAFQYAFGVHFNPELPNTNAETILAYLRAYLCLYDWIVGQENIDTTRQLSTYINHFNRDYVKRIVSRDYKPTISELIDDYLTHNPTRNRGLDLLPLFAHLDEHRVRTALRDEKINARPTLHYRLPNCDIDNPDWNLDTPWHIWLYVEKLAANPKKLTKLCSAYEDALSRITYPIENRWAEEVSESISIKNTVRPNYAM